MKNLDNILFECEGLITEHGFQGWSEIEINDFQKLIELLLPWDRNPYDEVRVKHLDKEDIESLGWRNNGIVTFKKYTDKGLYRLSMIHDKVKITMSSEVEGNRYFMKPIQDCIFLGIIKNKSELRNLMKQLNII